MHTARSGPGHCASLGVASVRFDQASGVLTVGIDFAAGSRFSIEGTSGEHPVHDTLTKVYRRLNFFQHECVLEVRMPRVRLPDGSVRLVKPPFAGKLSGFTLPTYRRTTWSHNSASMSGTAAKGSMRGSSSPA